MSNIFSGMKEVNDVNTTESAEFNQLLNMRVASELTKFHSPIFAAIMEDPNEDLKEIFKEELKESQGIFVEANDSERLLRANVLDTQNNRIFFVDMTTEDEEGSEKITQQTYDTLSEYVQDPILVMQNVKETLQDNAI